MRDRLAVWLRRLADRLSPARAGAQIGFDTMVAHAAMSEEDWRYMQRREGNYGRP